MAADLILHHGDDAIRAPARPPALRAPAGRIFGRVRSAPPATGIVATALWAVRLAPCGVGACPPASCGAAAEGVGNGMKVESMGWFIHHSSTASHNTYMNLFFLCFT